ncbi:MAG: glycosyltransferase family 2 protein [Hydrogenophaga sp.]|uniref:glycosyltransferase family 2 protein n=1 Tax=Hydrogenophaga sp. TaxID=1904254 RepID=UPI001DFC6A29|nr:glycosyltransferase family 2 protein [Hydrogenophaga sp.]MBX3611672.1 glycosyltransferase family 2 protein [Hydrogenophaga sp.]
MTVHVVIPVFNRLAMTRALVECLRRQQVDQPLHLLVVNDGSSDGTAAWLAMQAGITVLDGDGTLFWGGAIDLALKHLMSQVSASDWVLFMNNDTHVADDFVQTLLNVARAHAPAAVGSVIRDEARPERLLSIGARVDAWRIRTVDLLDVREPGRPWPEAVEVDALSGRGVLFPLESLKAAGGMRPRALPHYLADYELSLRVRARGWRLLVASAAAVLSAPEYGNMRRAATWRERLWSIRSPWYLPALATFWWEASNWPQRLTIPLRLPLFALFPRLRRPAP